ncbi:MAG TPA: RsmD family RNA methyltransferase, partial [Egibacteraceae bacterium]
LDLYAGVGLFARALAADGGDVVAVEADPSACDDARANLAEVGARVECDDVRRVLERRDAADVVVLDPPRKGAGPATSRRIAELDPRVVVYVSCDPAALARDAAAFVAVGYRLAAAVPVDQFAHTAQIETVATFVPQLGR